MLTVCCIKFGDYYPPKYVNVLYSMVQKNLGVPHNFVCFTDNPEGVMGDVECRVRSDLHTWWNKYWCFRLHGHVLYLDLDVCITGQLDEVADHCPGIVDDWLYDDHRYNGSVISWQDGQLDPILYAFNLDIREQFRGFQYWISEEPLRGRLGMKAYPPEWCVSYRKHAVDCAPPDSRVVCFHGLPNPHECLDTWVGEVWK